MAGQEVEKILLRGLQIPTIGPVQGWDRCRNSINSRTTPPMPTFLVPTGVHVVLLDLGIFSVTVFGCAGTGGGAKG